MATLAVRFGVVVNSRFATSDIFSRCDGFKMIWIHAGAVPAYVVQRKPSVNIAFSESIRNAVRSIGGLAKCDPTVSSLESATLPNPARIGALNLGQEEVYLVLRESRNRFRWQHIN